jgi:hypothetical protein
VLDPSGEVAHADDEPVDAQFVGVVEPGSFEESVDVNLLDALVHVVLADAEPEGVEECVGAVLDPAEDERVGLCLASVVAVLLHGAVGEHVVEPDHGP